MEFRSGSEEDAIVTKIHRYRTIDSIGEYAYEHDGNFAPQYGIERLKGENATWEKLGCWEGMKAAFGGPLSLAWLSPFTDLTCERHPSPRIQSTPQGEIIEEDVIEIPLEY